MTLDGRGRVLIADRDAEFRLNLYRRLLDGDVFSDITGDGREALDRLTNTTYAVVVLDLLLPQIGAERILEILNEQPRRERPVILVIAPPGAARSLDVDLVQIVLRRPCDIRQLAEIVQSCVRITEHNAVAAPPAVAGSVRRPTRRVVSSGARPS